MSIKHRMDKHTVIHPSSTAWRGRHYTDTMGEPHTRNDEQKKAQIIPLEITFENRKN